MPNLDSMLFFKCKSKNYIKHFSKGIIWNELVIFGHDPDKVTNSFSDYKFFLRNINTQKLMKHVASTEYLKA